MIKNRIWQKPNNTDKNDKFINQREQITIFLNTINLKKSTDATKFPQFIKF